jgi:alpha-L-rhamnosidase
MQHVYWRVKVWSNNGTSNCSKINYFETGLFSISEWKAKWIKTDKIKDPKHSISPYFRKEFVVNKKVKKARVYASAIGLYELHLNGNKVGDEYFTPGFTSYRKRIQYQVYDITKNIMNGDNALGFVLGNGWAVNFIQNWGKPKVNENIKPTMAGIVQVVIDYEDGTQDVIITDNKWKTSTGPILSSTIYGGESYDARKEQTGWDRIGFDDSQWEPTSILDESLDILVGAQGEPVIKNEIINPIKIWKNDKGEVIADMGQNMVGWVQLKINGNRGDKITLKHAEVLDSQGHFYTGNLRRAKQIIDYTLKGEGEEIYEPHFTCT